MADEVEPASPEYAKTTQKGLLALEEILKRPVKLKDHLELDLGLDSLNRIELLLNLESRLNLKMSEAEAMEFFLSSTVEQLLGKLEKVLPKVEKEIEPSGTFLWEKVLQEPSQAETLKQIQIHFGFLSVIFNILVISVFKIFFKVFFLLRTQGEKNLSHNGPYLICPNHTSYLDGLFILTALPFKIALQTYFVGYRPFFDNVFIKRFVKVARLIPLEISFNLIEALKACTFVLRNNKILCYFPEGQRSIDGKVKDFKKGVGILVKELDIPVVPVYIEGAYRTWSRTMRFPKLAPVKVIFGEKLFLKDLAAVGVGEDIYKKIAKNLQGYVEKLGEDH